MPPRPHGEESVLLSAPLLADVEEEGAGVAAVATAAGLVHAHLNMVETFTISISSRNFALEQDFFKIGNNRRRSTESGFENLCFW